jgi:hypothetical protein
MGKLEEAGNFGAGFGIRVRKFGVREFESW